ncbi:MAG TPA: flavoprotein [Trebonia sp.]
MTAPNPVLSVIVCGAGPAADVGTLVKQAIGRGWTVQVIATPSGLPFFDSGEIERLTGTPVRSQYSKPGAPRSRIPDAIIVAPATFSTINQWALGISGTYALGVLAEQTGLGIPIVVLPYVSDALASRPPFRRSLSALRAEGVSILLGSDGVPVHPAHSEEDHLAGFPWHAALDEVAAMTGLGELTCRYADVQTHAPARHHRDNRRLLRDRYRRRGPAGIFVRPRRARALPTRAFVRDRLDSRRLGEIAAARAMAGAMVPGRTACRARPAA